MCLYYLLLLNDHRSVLGFCVLSVEVPEGRAAELTGRLQSQRLFMKTLLLCRGSFCTGNQYKKRVRGGQQLMAKKNKRK